MTTHCCSRQNLAHARCLGTLLSIVLGAAPGQVFAEPLARPAAANDSGADSTSSIHDLMETGLKAYGKHNLEAARESFARAWALKQHEAIAASLADVEQKLGRYHDAALHWAYVLEHTSAERSPGRVEAEAHLQECRKHLGALHVTADRGALLFLDDQPAERGMPGQDLLVKPGNHTLRAELAGRKSPSQSFSIGEGEQLTLVLIVPPELIWPSVVMPAPPVMPSAPPASQSHGISTRAAVLIGGGAMTALALGVGVGFLLKANHLRDESERLRSLLDASDPELAKIHGNCAPSVPQPPPECSALDSALNDYDRARNTATAAFVTSGVLAVGTAVVFVLTHGSDSESQKRTSFVELEPWLGEGRRGVALRGAF